MKKLIFALVISSSLFTSCVSSKVYNELKDRHASLEKENAELSEQYEQLRERNRHAEQELVGVRAQLKSLQEEHEALREDFQTSQANLEKLRDSYDALEANSSSALAANSRRNRELLARLEEKEKALLIEKERLEKLEKDLAARSQRVDELEGVIAAKDAKMNALKDALSKALTNFEGKGLTVEQRNGKVYVSMENKLLFGSGSWSVGPEGQQAVSQLASVLAENPDIAVLIEGHTDNVPYKGKGPLDDNWDLSTKRATAIVELLQKNPEIDPQNLTAAGRGEYAPIASNKTAEGRAKNRRIEVILTPKLDEVNKLLEEMD